MRTLWLVPLALPLLAASPPRQLTLGAPGSFGLQLPTAAQSAPPGALPNTPVYEPAPLPNYNLNAPRVTSAPAQTTLSPTLFTQREQYRGDGFSPGSTAQSEQERNVRPAAGFSLHMPLTPQ